MYSQQNEEEQILAATADLTDRPRFLDIGAWDPKEFSNTRALFERGWGGVMIEPSPVPFNNLLKEYGNEKRITLVCAAVALEPGLVTLWATADAVSSTIEPTEWKSVGGYYGKFQTPAITPAEISNRFGGFQFVNIDAEGISVDLFKVFIGDLNWRPNVWCVEIDKRAEELAAVAEAAGYRSAGDLRFGTLGNGTNVVLVKK